MITLTYVGSGVAVVALALVFLTQAGGVWGFIGVLIVAFFLASAGASAAYLTVSEIFPMETRALAIAFFYAMGTAIGGISGPLLFGHLINSGQRDEVVWSFLIGAIVMAAAGLVELWLGIAAEGRPLEELALPLTVEDAERQEQSAPLTD
jgi:MFS family permease